MAISNLVPWRRGGKKVLVKREEEYPFYAMQRDLDRLFDDFFRRGFEMAPLGAFGESSGSFTPTVDVTVSDKEVTVSAELPGMDENDIEVSLTRDTLIISGEKRAEKEDKGDNYYHLERSYGSFQRTVPLPAKVDADKVDATFKNGVLTVKLSKTAVEQSKRIAVKS